jgi:hypothetical protein
MRKVGGGGVWASGSVSWTAAPSGFRWRHAVLHCSWRGQALPDGGLLQVRSTVGDTGHCRVHGGGRRCQHEGSLKGAEGGTQNCIAHGGGRRCQEEGCSKSAVQDGTDHCKTHGGGRRCQHPKPAASGGTQYCFPHGGGRRCQTVNCPKAAATGGTPNCKAHGGGRRCQHEGCSKAVARAPGSTLCTLCLRRTQPQPDDAEAQ